MNKYFKRIIGVGNGDYIYFWKSKGLSDERINSITASNDRKGAFSFGNGFGRNCIIFGVDMSSSVHVDNKKILFLGEGPTQELDGTTLTVEKKYSLNFTGNKKFCLRLHYNGANSYMLMVQKLLNSKQNTLKL